jgi:hypothetical protein
LELLEAFKPSPIDAGSNVTDDGLNQYVYEWETASAQLRATSPRRSPDTDGNRVIKGTLSGQSLPLTSAACDIATNLANHDFTFTNRYIDGGDGSSLAETDADGNLLHSDAFVNGQAGGPCKPSFCLGLRGEVTFTQS